MPNEIDLVKEKNTWETLTANIIKEARLQGATAAEVSVGNEIGFSVTVRMGEVETIEHNRDKGVSVVIYYGHKRGAASTTDTSESAIKNTVAAACQIARLGGEDPCAGLADPELMANNYPDLDLYHPWNIKPEQAVEIAKECEDLARAYDNRIVNSEGATLASHQGLHVYGNTHDFIGTYLSTRHNLSCVVVAQDKNGMQRDYGYTTARDYRDLTTTTAVAREAGEKTVSRLSSRRLKTCQTPVIFRADVAGSLLAHFLGAISGGNLYRKASFLIDHIGKPVFSKHIQIHERAHILKGLGSVPFDLEGVATKDRELIVDGILQGYLLGSYSGRKLGLQSTGNSGGAHNILIDTSSDDLEGLLKKMDTGLLVTEVMGQGVNLVTGDYSRGAVGFWVEKGIIQYPVEEVTIAGNLRDMFGHLVAVGSDIDHRNTILTGSILLESMTIAGE